MGFSALLGGLAITSTDVDVALAHVPHDVIGDVELSPDFARDATLYVISREYLLKSTDGGRSWHRLQRGLDNKSQLSSISTSAHDSGIVYVSSRGDGIYRSADGGSTWSHRSNGLGPGFTANLVVVSPHSDDFVLTGDLGGALFMTTDGGAFWTRVPDVTGVRSIGFSSAAARVVYLGTDDGDVVRSDDAGTTWTSTAVTTGGAVRTIAVSPNDETGRTVYAGTDNGLAKSTDGGISFTPSSADTPAGDDLPDRRIRSLAVGRGGGDRRLWAATWTGVARSDDGGATWVDAGKGLTMSSQADRFDLPQFSTIRLSTDAGSGGNPTMFVAGFDGLFRSHDLAESWTPVETQYSTIIVAVAVSPDFPSDQTIAVATYLNGAYLSTDAGRTWHAINEGLAHRATWVAASDYVARLMGISFSPSYPADETLFSGTRGLFLRSTNRGADWRSAIPRGLLVRDEFPPDFLIPVFSPNFAVDRTIIAATDGGKVFSSDDAGSSFTRLDDLGAPVVDLRISPDFGRHTTLFAGIHEGVLRSDDGGASWTPTGTLPARSTSIAISNAFASDATVFAGTAAGLFVSRDRGRAWDEVAVMQFEAPFIESIVVSPAFADDGTVLVSVRGAGLFRSIDHGATFHATGEALVADQHVFANYENPTSEPIVFSPGFVEDATVFAFSETQVFRTTDRGATWEALVLPVTMHDTAEEASANPLLDTPRFGDDMAPSDDLTDPGASDGSGGSAAGDSDGVGRVAALVTASVVFVAVATFALARRARGMRRAHSNAPD